MKGIRVYILIAAAVLAAGAFFAYRTYNKPHRDIASEKTVWSGTSDALYEVFDADEASANERYLDQVVEVTGPVEDIAENGEGLTVFTLSAESSMMGGVSATLAADAEGADRIASGDVITLKCRCTGMLMDVVLVDCSINDDAS